MRHAHHERAIDEDRGLTPVGLLLAVAVSGLVWWGVVVMIAWVLE